MNEKDEGKDMDQVAILEALREVIDPEVGINVVDMGLIYRVDAGEGGIQVEMTMTSPACPVGEMLRHQAVDTLRWRFPDAGGVRVDLVWNPPWRPEMMSLAARQALGLPV